MDVVEVKLKTGYERWQSKDTSQRLYAVTTESGALEVGYRQVGGSILSAPLSPRTICIYAPGEWRDVKIMRPSDQVGQAYHI